MPLLTDSDWKTKYDPDDGPLVVQFYDRALEAAQRYDRTTGYFTAAALTLAARGVEGLVLNAGRMRMVVGCTLNREEAEAIERGESLRGTIEASLLRMPLAAASVTEREALELLAWMVARGHLEVKVAVPCDEGRHVVAGSALFHEKAGVIEDKAGNRLAFAGSVNETAQGWTRNWESFHVFCDWDGGGRHIDAEEQSFARLWSDKSARARVQDVPSAVREDLLRFLPPEGDPQRLRERRSAPAAERAHTPKPAEAGTAEVAAPTVEERRRAVWRFIWTAPTLPQGAGAAQATSAVVPWPHQARAFRRMLEHWPPRLLIADEVGLGKTIEAGLALRYAWLSGRAKRILVLAPKAVLTQWQAELREKFNLNWPIYDGRTLCRYPSPSLRARHEQDVGRGDWHREPFVIASSQLMRRRERQAELLEQAEPWDLVVIDEAHHARRKSPGQPTEGAPNLLLRLAQGLSKRSKGMLLLTATPMQVHPVEVWDLLSLLGMPEAWTRTAFVEFFRRAANPNPSHEDFDALARLFRVSESSFGQMPLESAVRRTPGNSRLKANRILRALRDSADIPRRQLSAEERRAGLAIMRAHTPVAALVSRHTRDLLRAYHRRGLLQTPIASREVTDEFLPMSQEEAEIYSAVEDYIATTYDNARQEERSAVGFVMTTYRKRLASSFFALRRTLEERLDGLRGATAFPDSTRSSEDAQDDEDDAGDTADDELVAERKRDSLRSEETSEIESLLVRVARLPPDTKANRLDEVIRALVAGAHRGVDGSLLGPYAQVIVFTQYTDTLDYLRHFLKGRGHTILCFSGRGGEWLQPDGSWRTIGREETRRRFRDRQAQVLLCTDAAAEGLNFQFCGALVNFDAPWNPMRIEQRIGRVDRLGQEHARIAIVNLLYEDTVETDVYRALRARIGLFTSVVGRLQPILSSLPARIAEATLARPDERQRVRSALVASLATTSGGGDSDAFDIDEMVEAALDMAAAPAAPYDMAQLRRLIDRHELLPSSVSAERTSSREVFWTQPGQPEVSVTTDADFYEQHPESVEFWSPGSPAFPSADQVEQVGTDESATTLDELLDRWR